LLAVVERNRVAESHAALRKSQMKFVSESCHRAQGTLQSYATVKALEKEIEDQKVHGKRQVEQLCRHRGELQRFVVFTTCTTAWCMLLPVLVCVYVIKYICMYCKNLIIICTICTKSRGPLVRVHIIYVN